MAELSSNTPDFIIAQYLLGALGAFERAIQQRETWYGRDATPSCKVSCAVKEHDEMIAAERERHRRELMLTLYGFALLLVRAGGEIRIKERTILSAPENMFEKWSIRERRDPATGDFVFSLVSRRDSGGNLGWLAAHEARKEKPTP